MHKCTICLLYDKIVHYYLLGIPPTRVASRANWVSRSWTLAPPMALFSGEIASLRRAFHETFGDKRDLAKQKSIVKQVIGCMTMGIDAAPLFTEMIMVRA